jgi:hypothetical protein
MTRAVDAVILSLDVYEDWYICYTYMPTAFCNVQFIYIYTYGRANACDLETNLFTLLKLHFMKLRSEAFIDNYLKCLECLRHEVQAATYTSFSHYAAVIVQRCGY